MDRISVKETGDRLSELLDQVAEGREPVMIQAGRGNAVLVSEECWDGVLATLDLLSVSGMRQSILEGMAAPLDQCSVWLGWE